MATISKGHTKDTIEREITIVGTHPVMFDRFPGDLKTVLRPDQKFYFNGDSDIISYPALNIKASFCTVNGQSFPKRLRDSRTYKKICQACLSFTEFGPEYLPFTRNGEVIRFVAFLGPNERDEASGAYVHHAVGKVIGASGPVPTPMARPVLPVPWQLEFKFKMYPNTEITEEEIYNLMVEGGRALGIGAYRGVFGKFTVDKWD